MNTLTGPDTTKRHRPWLTAIGYLCAGAAIYVGWVLSDQHLIDAADGAGYWLGIVGASMMVLLLLYPLRKRARWLRNAGPVRHWFRVHMILGILGPLLVLIHSNFTLGSVNSRVALICTLVVAGSGIIGRYLYAKTHNGLYGQKLTMESMRDEVARSRARSAAMTGIIGTIDEALTSLESRTMSADPRLLPAIALAFRVTVEIFLLRFRIRRMIQSNLNEFAATSSVIEHNRKRLLRTTFHYLDRRLSVLRKFAQLRACERLFSLWHLIHYPLFMVLFVAALVHVIAVNMY